LEEKEQEPANEMTASGKPRRIRKKNYYKRIEICWSALEDEKLLRLCNTYGHEARWRAISKHMGKSMIKCHQRYLQLTNQSEKAMAKWTKEEDSILKEYVLMHGEYDWQKVANQMPGRLAKQCRERWLYKVDPTIVKQKWTPEEDCKIAELYQKLGSQWTEIAKSFPGRKDNQIKNRFNQNIKRRLNKG